jgi:multicomponent Na+:H+ antiporter subunit D
VGKLEVFRTVADHPALIAVVLLGSLLSFVYAFQIYQFERWRPGPDTDGTRGPWRQWVVPVAIGGVILGLGLWPEPLLALSDAAAGVLPGIAR